MHRNVSIHNQRLSLAHKLLSKLQISYFLELGQDCKEIRKEMASKNGLQHWTTECNIHPLYKYYYTWVLIIQTNCDLRISRNNPVASDRMILLCYNRYRFSRKCINRNSSKWNSILPEWSKTLITLLARPQLLGTCRNRWWSERRADTITIAA